MRLEGDAIIMDVDDVEWLFRQIYTELSEFLGEGPTKLVIPAGSMVLGLTITTKVKRNDSVLHPLNTESDGL